MSEVSATSPMLLRASTVTVTATFFNDAGVAADPGSTTVSVSNLAGTVVLASAAAGTPVGVTTRTVALSGAVTADLDTLTVTWVTTNFGTLETVHEVIGRYLFTVAEARAFRPNAAGGAPLADTGKYTGAAIENARAAILDELETITGQAFVPRYRLVTRSGNGMTTLYLDSFNVSTLRSVETRTYGTQTWTALTTDELADVYLQSWGELRRESFGAFVLGNDNVRIGYVYGHTTPPRDIVKAALMMLVDNLVASNISDRAISVSGELGTSQMFTAGISARGQALYSSPEVHRILSNHVAKRVVIA